MSIPRIAEALGYIDDELIDGAQKETPAKRFNWARWTAAAACVCIAGAAIYAGVRFGESISISVFRKDPDITVSEEEPKVTTQSEGPITNPDEQEENDPPRSIGGVDSLNRRYVDDAYGIYCCVEIVGSEKVDEWVNGIYLNEYCKDEYRLPDLYLACRDLEITKDMLLDYNEKYLSKNPNSKMVIPDYVVEAIYLEDEVEVIKSLTNPAACYYEGRSYTFYEMISGEADVPQEVLAEYILEMEPAMIEYFGEERYEDEYGELIREALEKNEADAMSEFGRDFLEMYFRALDLNEPYDLDEYIDIPLLKKYVDMLVERRQFNKELFGAPSDLGDYKIEISLTEKEQLDGCYRLTYSIVTEYTYPGSDFRSGQGEGMYLLIREKGDGYELVGMQHTVKDGYFTGDRWGDTWEEQRSFLVSDPEYWVNESEEEMLGWFDRDRQAAISTAQKQQQDQAEADAKKPVTIQEGLEAGMLEVIERHNKYLLYAERDDAAGLDYSEKYSYGGIEYYPVTNEEIDEWQELQDLIDSIFCDGHSKEKHTVQGVFTEVDGKTYRRKTGNKKTETAPVYLRSYHDDGNGNVSVLAAQDQNDGKTYISIQYNFHYEEEIGWRMSGYDTIAH